MAITSSRTLQIFFSGDVTEQVIQSALDNVQSSGQAQPTRLNAGNNTITAPVVNNIINTGLTIIPPAGNTTVITLKGVAGDTGILLHLTDPTTIALGSAFVSLVLNVATQLDGVRLVWT